MILEHRRRTAAMVARRHHKRILFATAVFSAEIRPSNESGGYFPFVDIAADRPRRLQYPDKPGSNVA